MDVIRDRYVRVLERIDRSARSVGRDPSSVRLLVVTKLQPVEIVQEVIASGARYLGENYADEALVKKQALHSILEITEIPGIEAEARDLICTNREVQWHIIGHVQSRKARLVSEYFDALHSLDSLKLAKRLNNYCAEFKRVLPVLLEFNVSGEESKSGWPAWDKTHWADLLTDIDQIVGLPQLKVSGLMTMPPFFENPETTRPYFQRLRNLQDYLMKKIPDADWHELSMGMSVDFEVAVQEGATWVRVGQAILGPRIV